MTRAKGRKFPQESHTKSTLPYRGVKCVIPECHVLVNQNFHNTVFQEYTTGPCQQAVKDNPRLRYAWYKTCTHGPEQFEDGTPIPEHERPYYDVAIKTVQKPYFEDGVYKGMKDEVEYKIAPRIRDIAWNTKMFQGQSITRIQGMGGRSLESFDIAPFCELKGCWEQGYLEQDGTRAEELKQFKNGIFCSELHAKLVKATESRIFLHLPWDSRTDNPISTERRQEQLAAIDV